jgi:hypothetical protein
VAEIKRLAEYLEVSPDLAISVAEETQFNKMKTDKKKTDDPYSLFFKDSNGHEHIYREGKVFQD